MALFKKKKIISLYRRYSYDVKLNYFTLKKIQYKIKTFVQHYLLQYYIIIIRNYVFLLYFAHDDPEFN